MDHAADAHRTDLMTITRHVLNEQSRNPESRGDFTILLSHIVLGCKFVASAVNKAGLAQLIGLAGETNVQASSPRSLAVAVPFFFREIGRDVTMLPWLFDRERSRRSWTSCPTRCSSRPSSAAVAPYEYPSLSTAIIYCPFEFRECSAF